MQKLIAWMSTTTEMATINHMGEFPLQPAHHHSFPEVPVCWPQSALPSVKNHIPCSQRNPKPSCMVTTFPPLLACQMKNNKERVLPHFRCCQPLILQKLSLQWSLRQVVWAPRASQRKDVLCVDKWLLSFQSTARSLPQPLEGCPCLLTCYS